MEYEVVLETNIHDLMEIVNLHIKDGWEPQGGICANGIAFYQAMIRKKQSS